MKREANMEDPAYRTYKAPKKKKKKNGGETYEQLGLPIRLGKKKFKNDPLTSPNEA